MSLPDPDGINEDEQRSAREFGHKHLRKTRRVRFGCGLIIGFAVALLFLARYGRRHPVGWLGLLIAAGIVLAVAGIVATNTDQKATEDVEWLVFPTGKLISLLPQWVFALLLAVVGFGLIALAFAFSG